MFPTAEEMLHTVMRASLARGPNYPTRNMFPLETLSSSNVFSWCAPIFRYRYRHWSGAVPNAATVRIMCECVLVNLKVD